MKKKKLALISSAAILSLALAGTIGVVAASADTTLSNSGESSGMTKVTYKVDETWTVTIPQSIVLEKSGEEVKGTGEVKAENVVIEQGKKLTVTVESDNDWSVKDSSKAHGFTYELKSNKATTPGSALDESDNNKVLSVDAGNTAGDTANLTATVTDDNAGKYATSGDNGYEDTLTFTVTVA